MKYSATIGNAGYQNIIMPDLMHQCTIQHLIPPTKTIPNVIHIASNMQIYNDITAQRKKEPKHSSMADPRQKSQTQSNNTQCHTDHTNMRRNNSANDIQCTPT